MPPRTQPNARQWFRLVRDLSKDSTDAVLSTLGLPQRTATPFDISDEKLGLDWQGNAIEGTYWGDIMLKAKKDGMMVIPNVDACTAWCAVNARLHVVCMKDLSVKPNEVRNGLRRGFPARNPGPLPRVRKGSLVPSSLLWAFHTTVDFAKQYMVPYFDMVERGEIPDTSLLEWLVTMGGIDPKIARAAVERYSKKRRGDSALLYETDRERLLAAAEAREAAVADEAAAPVNTDAVSP